MEPQPIITHEAWLETDECREMREEAMAHFILKLIGEENDE